MKKVKIILKVDFEIPPGVFVDDVALMLVGAIKRIIRDKLEWSGIASEGIEHEIIEKE